MLDEQRKEMRGTKVKQLRKKYQPKTKLYWRRIKKAYNRGEIKL